MREKRTSGAARASTDGPPRRGLVPQGKRSPWLATVLILVPMYFMPFAMLVEDAVMAVVLLGKAIVNGVLAAVARPEGSESAA